MVMNIDWLQFTDLRYGTPVFTGSGLAVPLIRYYRYGWNFANSRYVILAPCRQDLFTNGCRLWLIVIYVWLLISERFLQEYN